MDYIKVSAAIIEKDGYILIGRRKAGRLKDMWEFPGGKLEAAETPEECLKRELREELSIEAAIGEFFLSSKHAYSHARIELLAYKARIVGGAPCLHDHKEIKWVPAEDLRSYAFPAADRPIVEKLIRESKKSALPLLTAEKSLDKGFMIIYEPVLCTLSKTSPETIMASITAFGRTGPRHLT